MNTLKDLQGHTGREQSMHDVNTYKGIPMFCDEGLHEACFKRIAHTPHDSRILILGSGSGAFDQRLVDAGFSQVTSLDFRPDFFRATGTNFIERDLNHDFSDLGTFDLIVAIELVEHMENPAHFLRNAAKCLDSKGTLLVTTPNIESGPSRAGFLMMGRITFFTETDLEGSGHISPLFQHIFAFHAHNADLTIVSHSYNRNAWVARFRSNTREILKNLGKFSLHGLFHAISVTFKSIILFLLWPLTGMNAHNGNVHIYELRKS